MPTVYIDDFAVEVPEGTTILQAARQIGGDIVPPAMCYYNKLEGSGGYCRTCLVKVEKMSEKAPNPMPKLVPSCRTTVMDGMVVRNISSPEVVEARAGVVEFLLINHPLDCPVCDQAGECHLQDLGYDHGKLKTRSEFKRRTFDPIDIGDKIKLHMNRCILCYRCVKTCEQITDGRVHGVINRGDHAEISTYIEQAIDNDFSGNVIDVCPVGALTDRTFRFKSRIWYTKPLDAHRNCDKCCGKVQLYTKGEEILRISARKNQWGEVVEWICNDCRFEKKQWNDWVVEGPSKVERHSVIAQNHYQTEEGNRTDKPALVADALPHGAKVQPGQGALNPNNQPEL